MVEGKFDDLVEDLMKNPRFKEEYDALKPEFDAVRVAMDARMKSSAGMLAKYAAPDMMPLETLAWAEAAEKKRGKVYG